VERDAQRDELHLCERVLASLNSPPPVSSTDEPEEEVVEPFRFRARGGTQPVEARTRGGTACRAAVAGSSTVNNKQLQPPELAHPAAEALRLALTRA
jgi:hypothetical protein